MTADDPVEPVPGDRMTDASFIGILVRLLDEASRDGGSGLAGLEGRLEPAAWTTESAVCALNAAFLLALLGPAHRASGRAASLLDQPPPGASRELADFYRIGVGLIDRELDERLDAEPDLTMRLQVAAQKAEAESFWILFFPEGVGIVGREPERTNELRARRTVSITRLNPRPIADPAREILFTSNVLLTIPSASTDVDSLPYSADLRREIRLTASEPQDRWYDHPIQIGVEPEHNELLYGLRGLDRAIDFERRRTSRTGRVKVVLSVSVTHARLQHLAHAYVREELDRSGAPDNLDVHVFTEHDAGRLVREILAPALGTDAEQLIARVFGTDGEYGRHYNFLKAISAFWQLLIDPSVRATFKIDLDQVFAQEVLVAETGATAFEHLATPLWGATGRDSGGEEIELGMLAGALVNERDIGRGLFTPDVDFPAGPASPDEYVFFSRLPQALSTRAEMMERYDSPERDGRTGCLERIHVTGGTNGILVESLRRHRPFTPSFFGRAEDQAYIMSGLAGTGPRLAYAHAAGLIMRHDKEAFAGEAIDAARVGKLVGDDVRILYFSAYANALGRERVKALLDPFTGCFISHLPVTVVLLRFALRVADAFERGDTRLGSELAQNGAQRIAQALAFTADSTTFRGLLDDERAGWAHYYDALDALESRLDADDGAALGLRRRAREIVESTLIGGQLEQA